MESPNEPEVIPDFGLDVTDEQRAELGLQLGEIRKAKKISQEYAAKRIGMSRSHLSNIEVGRSRPGWGRLMAMSAFYDVPIEEMISKLVEPPLGETSAAVPKLAQLLREPVRVEAYEGIGIIDTKLATLLMQALRQCSDVERRRLLSALQALNLLDERARHRLIGDFYREAKRLEEAALAP